MTGNAYPGNKRISSNGTTFEKRQKRQHSVSRYHASYCAAYGKDTEPITSFPCGTPRPQLMKSTCGATLYSSVSTSWDRRSRPMVGGCVLARSKKSRTSSMYTKTRLENLSPHLAPKPGSLKIRRSNFLRMASYRSFPIRTRIASVSYDFSRWLYHRPHS
jgi:hypothetical protein